jgi:Tfp pilus assembly protein PilV
MGENPVGLPSKALKTPLVLSMAYGMPTRARQTEDGFILIEVLVSAVILAIVAGAVLTLIAATTRSAASSRSHSVAYGLAQEDQARMRTMRISSLNHLDSTKERTIGGTTYSVRSTGTFVNNKAGTPSCTEANASADYVAITSTVSSPVMPHPVTLQSVVSPTSGSLDPSHGTISFQVKNALGGGVGGVSLTGSGPSNFSGSSESSGCAVFADLPSGNYKVVANGNGLITPDGKETWTKEQVGAPASGTQQVQIRFDTPGTIAAHFVYKEPTQSEPAPAPVDSMELFNSENEQKTLTFGTPTATPRLPVLEDKAVFPFQTKYLVYAGSCTSNNPDPKSEGINTAALGKVEVTAGAITTPPPIQIPALNLTVKDSSGKAVQGAKVILTDTTCKYNGRNVEREFTTNKVGHIVNSGATELGTETQAVGLPFGTYEICASATISGNTRRAEVTGKSAVPVNSLEAATPVTLKLGTISAPACS